VRRHPTLGYDNESILLHTAIGHMNLPGIGAVGRRSVLTPLFLFRERYMLRYLIHYSLYSQPFEHPQK